MLARLGPVTTVVVPVCGPVHDGDVSSPLAPAGSGDVHVPERARRAPEHLGRAWRREQVDPAPDLVLAVGADVGPFALGVAAGTDAFVAVDVNDDDAAFHRSMDDDEEAERYAGLVEALATRADLLLSVTGFGPTLAVPNCVDVAPSSRRAPEGPGTVLMVGNFTYPPNERGARWFLDEVLPIVAAARPDTAVRFAGVGSEALPPHGLGFVEDLGPLYDAATVAVVPLLEGSGSRIKALEAFAAGVPVVGTTVGMSGLPVRHDVDCLIADGPDTFASAVLDVLGDPDLGSRLVQAARATVAGFDRPVVVAEAADLLRAALPERRTPRFRPAPGLVETEEPDGLVVVDEVAMVFHHLNPFATSVFLLAESGATVRAITEALADLVGQPPDELARPVATAVSDLAAAGLLLASHGEDAG